MVIHGCLNNPLPRNFEGILKIIRSKWKNVKSIIRGDSAYSREEIMAWCESKIRIDYVFGLAPNNRLLQLAQSIKYRASQEYSRKTKPIVEFFETLFPSSPDVKNDAAAFIENSVWYCSLLTFPHPVKSQIFL
ncbi:MAG: transposase [Cyanobacteria bacterium P01_D01_bin.44]